MALKNPIFEFFGIKRPLFNTQQLSGEDLERFVNQEQNLRKLEASILMEQNCGIVGDVGSGKSSFMVKMMEEMKRKGLCYGAYLQFNLNNENREKLVEHFLRTVLQQMVWIIIANDELLSHLNNTSDVDLYSEVQRLDRSFLFDESTQDGTSFKGGLEAGTGSILPANLKLKLEAGRAKTRASSEKVNLIPHTDLTLRDSIRLISSNLNMPLVLFIDELDKVGREPLNSPDWDKEVLKILELSREIMMHSNLIFVFTLQQKLREKLKAARRSTGDPGILGLIPAYVELEDIDIDFANKIVTTSLEFADYEGAIDSLFEEGVIEIVLSLSRKRIRLFINHLLELVKFAYESENRVVRLAILKDYLFGLFPELDDGRWTNIVEKKEFPEI